MCAFFRVFIQCYTIIDIRIAERLVINDGRAVACVVVGILLIINVQVEVTFNAYLHVETCYIYD